LKVILFGASGIVGQGALRQLLLEPEVEAVLGVGRSAVPLHHPKLKQLVQEDVGDLEMLGPELSGYDACLFCLDVPVSGLSETDYRRTTHEITLKIALMLERFNPKMTFVYVSAGGADATERGHVMWARVKGATENALLAMPFARAYMLRPGFVRPGRGVYLERRLDRAFFALLRPLSSLLSRAFPGLITTTEELGAAMLELLEQGSSERVLENRDIVALARRRRGLPAAG